jgi:hypothetical protein
MKTQYNFGVNNLPNTKVTMMADWEDFAAAAAAGKAGKSDEAQEQIVRKRLMSRIRVDAGDVRLVPLD